MTGTVFLGRDPSRTRSKSKTAADSAPLKGVGRDHIKASVSRHSSSSAAKRFSRIFLVRFLNLRALSEVVAAHVASDRPLSLLAHAQIEKQIRIASWKDNIMVSLLFMRLVLLGGACCPSCAKTPEMLPKKPCDGSGDFGTGLTISSL